MATIDFKVYNKYGGPHTNALNMAKEICPHNCADSGTCVFSSDNETIPCAAEWPHLTCYYDVITTSAATVLTNTGYTIGTYMRVDDKPIQASANKYTFDTTGEHVVKFYKNSKWTTISEHRLESVPRLTKIEGLGDIKTLNYHAISKNNNLKSIDLSDNFTAMTGSNGFYNKNLEEIGSIDGLSVLPSTDVMELGGTKLTYVSLKNIPAIEQNLFSGCTMLKEVYVGKKCTIVRGKSFYACPVLEKVVFASETVMTMTDQNAFTNSPNAIIYVPKDLVEKYKVATNWSKYASRIKPIPKVKVWEPTGTKTNNG